MRKGASTPYFALWVANDELLVAESESGVQPRRGNVAGERNQ